MKSNMNLFSRIRISGMYLPDTLETPTRSQRVRALGIEAPKKTIDPRGISVMAGGDRRGQVNHSSFNNSICNYDERM